MTSRLGMFAPGAVNYQAINDLAFTFAGLEVYVFGGP